MSTYGEHLYSYLYGLDGEGLSFEEDEAREWVAEVDALLKVAMAARAYNSRPTRENLQNMRDALKEVEKLGILLVT